MLELSKKITDNYTCRGTVRFGISIDDLVAALGSGDERVRREARIDLTHLGQPAVPSLVSALANPDTSMRLQAARTLRCIGDPAAAPALVRTLDDDDSDVRWFVAEALIAVGQNAIDPLLKALGDCHPALGLLDGAHRVLHDLDAHELLSITVQPVLDAMEGAEPFLNTPPAARAARKALKRESAAITPNEARWTMLWGRDYSR